MPKEAFERIKAGLEEAARGDMAEISIPLPSVTRFEAIDSFGNRAYMAGYDVYRGGPGAQVTLSIQDGGRTLKVFVERREP